MFNLFKIAVNAFRESLREPVYFLMLLSALVSAAVCGFSGAFSGLAWIWILPVSFLATVLVLVGLGFAFLMVLCRRVTSSVSSAMRKEGGKPAA